MSTTTISFSDHKESTAKDCEAIAEMITKIATEVRAGNMAAFERFWLSGGTEEGDAKILEIRERLWLRYTAREENTAK